MNMFKRKVTIIIGAVLVVVFLAFIGNSYMAGKYKVGESFRDCQKCPEVVYIPAGSYIMGTDEGGKAERPAHKVSISKPFAIGKYEVTFDEWQACLDEKACKRLPDDHKWGRGRRPVVNISWLEANDYLRWLSAKTSQTYRLPSEAEWEYAARAGTSSKYSWGNKIGNEKANCRDCAKEISHQTYPVGSFKPNPFGLYDVHGNVWEWVQDCWNPDYTGAPTDGSARQTDNCRKRVTRSGSWYYFSKNLQSRYRAKYMARAFSYGIGIRVLRELP